MPGVSLASDEGQEILASCWAKVRLRKPGLEPAPDAILTAVETGLKLPLEAGLALEQEKFAMVAASKVVKNKIRTLFLGLNDANGMKDRPEDIAPNELKSVAVVGVGQMGGGIAASNGATVTFTEWSSVNSNTASSGVRPTPVGHTARPPPCSPLAPPCAATARPRRCLGRSHAISDQRGQNRWI